MIRVLALLITLFASSVSAATYRYTGGDITSVDYDLTAPGAAYAPVGMPKGRLVLEFEANLAPEEMSFVTNVTGRIGQFKLNAMDLDIRVDPDGQITEWFAWGLQGNSDSLSFSSNPFGDAGAFRHEYSCSEPPFVTFCFGTEEWSFNANAGHWSVVPLPASGLLLAAACLGLWTRRRITG